MTIAEMNYAKYKDPETRVEELRQEAIAQANRYADLILLKALPHPSDGSFSGKANEWDNNERWKNFADNQYVLNYLQSSF